MLPFYDRSVIEHLTSINNIDAITIVYNKSDGCSKDLQLKYRALFGKKPIQLEFINSHKGGPVTTLNEVIETIDEEEKYAVSYCDYVCSEYGIDEFLEVSSVMSEECVDGAVLTYSGFHPHHAFPENIYGYLKINNDGYVVDYKEKSSFTEHRENEPCSAGMYFFKNGKILKELLAEVTSNRNEYLVNNELYISMLYKALLKRGGKVKIITTPYFGQLGTPQDYEDSVHWVSSNQALLDLKKTKHISNKKHCINAIFAMLCSGQGSRFKQEGYNTHKAFLKVNDKSIFEQIIDSLPKFKVYAFSIKSGDNETKAQINYFCQQRSINPIIIEIKTPNGGQADSTKSMLSGLEKKLDPEKQEIPIYIAPCDSVITFDYKFEQLLYEANYGVIGSETNPISRLSPQSYGYVRINKSNGIFAGELHCIENISVKKKLDSEDGLMDYIITGAFTSNSFIKLTKALSKYYNKIEPINDEKYLDSFYSLLSNTEEESKTKMIKCSTYNSLGTPLEYRIALYWINFLSILGAEKC